MSCDAVRPLLEAFVDGDLEREAAATLSAHLRACAPCAAQHRAALGLPRRLSALRSPGGPDLVPIVMARVRAGRRAAHLSAVLLTAEAILACLTLVQLGLDGLLASAAAALRDGSALLGGSAAGPAPGDLSLVLTLLVLVAITSIHLGLLGVSAPRRGSA